MEMAIYITKSSRLAPSEKLHKKMDAVSLAFFNVYANLNFKEMVRSTTLLWKVA